MTHRKLFFSIVALAVLLSVQTGTVWAESSGRAIVPFYKVRTRDGAIHGGKTIRIYPSFYVSNISEVTVTVKVSFYTQDGQLIAGNDNDPLSGYILLDRTQANYSEASNTDCTASFDLSTKESANIIIVAEDYFTSTDTQEYGFAKIAWTSSTDVVSPPLVATYREHTTFVSENGEWDALKTNILINNGMPF